MHEAFQSRSKNHTSLTAEDTEDAEKAIRFPSDFGGESIPNFVEVLFSWPVIRASNVAQHQIRVAVHTFQYSD